MCGHVQTLNLTPTPEENLTFYHKIHRGSSAHFVYVSVQILKTVQVNFAELIIA